MFDQDECRRCGHVRAAHEPFAAGGCGSRVRVAGRVKVCGCAEFREPISTPMEPAGSSMGAPAGQASAEAMVGLA